MPERVQLSRKKGYRKPEGAVVVSRPSKWGNPFRVGTRSGLARTPAVNHPGRAWEYEGRLSADGMRHDYFHPGGNVTVCHVRYMTAAEAVECYRSLLFGMGEWPLDFLHRGDYYPHVKNIHELRGKDLACWCPLVDSNGNAVPCHADVLLELANESAVRSVCVSAGRLSERTQR